jgi:hypothetical protein
MLSSFFSDGIWDHPIVNFLLILIALGIVTLSLAYSFVLLRRLIRSSSPYNSHNTTQNLKSSSIMSLFDSSVAEEVEDKDQMITIDETTALLIDKALQQSRRNQSSASILNNYQHTNDTEINTYFDTLKLDNSDELLRLKFLEIMSHGITVNLHTTKGPRPIVLSLHSNEVRWQALKSANKKYKMNLREIIRIDVGTKSSNFVRARSSIDSDLCLSLISKKSSLDISVGSRSDRDCLVLHIQRLVGLNEDYEII